MACNKFVNDNEASNDLAFEKCGPRCEMIGLDVLVYGIIEENREKLCPQDLTLLYQNRDQASFASVGRCSVLTHQSSRSGGLLRRVA